MYMMHQASIGAGYSFNFVPYHRDMHNLTINLTGLPMLNVLNKLTIMHPVSLQDLASWNEKKACWETARGVYHFCIGRSADKMQTDCSVLVKKTYLCGKQD